MKVNCASVQLASQPRLWSSSVHWLGDVSHFCLGIHYLGCMHDLVLTMILIGLRIGHWDSRRRSIRDRLGYSAGEAKIYLGQRENWSDYIPGVPCSYWVRRLQHHHPRSEDVPTCEDHICSQVIILSYDHFVQMYSSLLGWRYAVSSSTRLIPTYSLREVMTASFSYGTSATYLLIQPLLHHLHQTTRSATAFHRHPQLASTSKLVTPPYSPTQASLKPPMTSLPPSYT